jgi:hypothetical protein
MSVLPDQAQEQPRSAGRRASAGRRVWIAVALVAGLLLAVALVVLGWVTGREGDPDDADRIVSGPLEGRDQASLVLLDGATSVAVAIRDLGDRLYQVETPEQGAHLPVATMAEDEVRLELADREEGGTSAVEIQLSSAVRWQVRILAGSTEQVVDLAGGEVSGVELAGGATRIELTMPPPAGVTTVRMSGGVGQWTVHQLGDAPVRVRVGGGAGTVNINSVPHSGVAAGTLFSPPGWDSAQDRVDIDAVAGMSAFVLDRR